MSDVLPRFHSPMKPCDTVDARGEAPRTWLLMGHRTGDNAQMLALNEALGWPYEIKTLVYRPTELITNVLAGPTLAGLMRRKSSPLEPPWPRLIITAGRRNEPIARWIQRQAGGRQQTRLVHLGRPWAAPDCFDLVITTPQYRLPQAANILHNAAPFHRITTERLARAAAEWAPRLAHLPRPYVAVLLGGDVGPYLLDRENGALLGACANRMAAAREGSLLVTTSARTASIAIDALERSIAVPAYVHRWSKGAEDNPYLGYLALADEIIVTSDSMSMLIEAIAAGKQVFIFDLARGRGSMRPPLPLDGSVRPRSWWERREDWRWRPFVHRLGTLIGPTRLKRDVRVILRQQVAAGRAAWLGQPWPDHPPPPPPKDMQRAVARVKALFASPYGDDQGLQASASEST